MSTEYHKHCLGMIAAAEAWEAAKAAPVPARPRN